MNEQRRLAVRGIGRIQDEQFRAQIFQQPRCGALLTDEETHAIGAVRTFREWAQVETDDGFFQPAACGGDDFLVIDEQLPQLCLDPLSRILTTAWT